MIEVECSNGDIAEADDPASAIVAAKTLCEDAWRARPMHGHKPTVTFRVDGEVIAYNVPQNKLWMKLPA